jgi:NADH-quinone oxidoreductase subunit J
MTLQQVLFLILGALTLGAALLVVTQRNVFHAALALILCFFSIACLYVLLEAPFLAAVQVLIYVGGIATLIIFSIMLTRDIMSPDHPWLNKQWWAASLATLALGGAIVWVIYTYPWGVERPDPVPAHTLTTLGIAMVDTNSFVLAFEVASILLLVALIGAVAIARETQ